MGKAERMSFFDRLACVIPHSWRDDLLLEHTVGAEMFGTLQTRGADYICASAGIPRTFDYDELLSRLAERSPQMTNITPNGIIKPKFETTSEFNALHRAFSDIVCSFELEPLIKSSAIETNLRLVGPTLAPGIAERPYFSGKIHTDVWGYEPSDMILLNLMLFGDAERTTIKFFNPPDGMDDEYLVPLDNYNHGQSTASQFRACQAVPQIGKLYVSDCGVMHQTIREGGIRLSLDARLRRFASPNVSERAERYCPGERLLEYIPYPEWKKIGRESYIQFSDRLNAPPSSKPRIVEISSSENHSRI